MLNIHHVSENSVPTYLLLLVCQYEQISIKIGRIVPEFNKTMPKMPISLKVFACTTLGNLKCKIESSMQ